MVLEAKISGLTKLCQRGVVSHDNFTRQVVCSLLLGVDAKMLHTLNHALARRPLKLTSADTWQVALSVVGSRARAVVDFHSNGFPFERIFGFNQGQKSRNIPTYPQENVRLCFY